MRSLTTGRGLIALAGGHTLWAVLAHGRGLREIVGAGVAGTVGDGVFDQSHARDERAAAFWFLLTGALAAVLGVSLDDAERRGDQSAVRRATSAGTAVSLLGAAVVPRSGFAAAALLLAHGHARARRSWSNPSPAGRRAPRWRHRQFER